MMHIAASWESASSVLSSVALVAVALYMTALFAFPSVFAKKREEEQTVEIKACSTDTCLLKVKDEEVSTDGGETSESDCDTSDNDSIPSAPPSPARRPRVAFSEDMNETVIIPSCYEAGPDVIDISGHWTATSFASTSAPSAPPAAPGLDAPTTYSANILLACRPRAPPGLAPRNSLNYKTEPRPICDEASWGLPAEQGKKDIFNSYHRKQERVQQQEVAKARTDTELAARRANRPAAPWKRQTANSEWTL